MTRTFSLQVINRAVPVRLELINELLGMDYATFNILRSFCHIYHLSPFIHKPFKFIPHYKRYAL